MLLMSKGLKEALTILIVTHVTHVERVKRSPNSFNCYSCYSCQKCNFELTVFELTVPDLYYTFYLFSEKTSWLSLVLLIDVPIDLSLVQGLLSKHFLSKTNIFSKNGLKQYKGKDGFLCNIVTFVVNIFLESDFIERTGICKRLKQDAVPTVFPAFPKNTCRVMLLSRSCPQKERLNHLLQRSEKVQYLITAIHQQKRLRLYLRRSMHWISTCTNETKR